MFDCLMEQIIEIAFETLRSTRVSRYFSSVRPFFCNTVFSALVHNCSLIFCLTLEFNKHIKVILILILVILKVIFLNFLSIFYLLLLLLLLLILLLLFEKCFSCAQNGVKGAFFCAKSAFLSFSLNLFIKSLKKFR